MKKQDLKNGMVVETREGERYLVCGDCIISNNGWNLLSYYDEDLINEDHYELDIIRAYANIKSLDSINDSRSLQLIWEREWRPKVDEEYYLANVCSEDLYNHKFWLNTGNSIRWLERGLVFKTKEEAIECAKRMLDAIK